MYKKPKGTRDIFGLSINKWHKMENIAVDLAKQFNCSEIRTPTFEDSSLYLRSVGESSDIVTKEMYLFEDKAKRQMALRPEGTAGVVRAFIENGLQNQPLPQKYYYIGNNFRYENPQVGRYREFSQFGVECFGNESAWADVEMMQMCSLFVEKLGLKNTKLIINSIGCPNCRKLFNQALKEFAERNKDKLCEDCKTRTNKNPMRILDCKNANCQKILQNAPKLKDFLCNDCKNHFDMVKYGLEKIGVNFEVVENLVRGFDYYTKTVFEVVANNIDGKPLSIGGGGRYDNLVEEMGGMPTNCVGFAMGLDRIVLLLNEQNENIDVYLSNAGNVEISDIYLIANNLREQGFSVECNLTNKSLKKQFAFASKLGANFVCVLGDNEIKNKTITVKNLKTKQENQIELKSLVEYLKNNTN